MDRSLKHTIWTSRDSLESRIQEMQHQLSVIFKTKVVSRPHEHQLFLRPRGRHNITLHIDPHLKGRATITVELTPSKPRSNKELEGYDLPHISLASASFDEPQALKFLASEVNPVKSDDTFLLKEELSSRHAIPSFIRGLKLLYDTADTYLSGSPVHATETVPPSKWFLNPIAHAKDRLTGRFGIARKMRK